MSKRKPLSLLLWSLSGSLFLASCAGVGLQVYKASSLLNKPLLMKSLSPHAADPTFTAVCSDYENGVINMYEAEDDDNMLYPYVFNYNTGVVELNMPFTLRPGDYYIYFSVNDVSALNSNTLYSDLQFNAEYRKANGTVQKWGVDSSSYHGGYSSSVHRKVNDYISITSMNGNDAYPCIKFTLPDYNMPATGEHWKVTKFRFVINQYKNCGNITHGVMRKGNNLRFDGFPSYLHELCDVKINWTEALESGTHIRLDTDYGTGGITPENIVSAVHAVDLAKGDKCDVNVIEDKYTGSESVLGKPLQMKLASTDKHSNNSYLYFDIYVYDKVSPYIAFLNEEDKEKGLYFPYDKAISKEDVTAKFKITDNYDEVKKHTESVEGYDFTTGARKTLGDYPITISAQDVSANKTSVKTAIHFFDDVGPKITGPDSFNVSAGKLVNEDEILSKFRAVDEIDGENMPITLENNTYKDNYKDIGTYTVDVVSKDKSGNRSSLTLLMNNSDSEGPVFYVDTDVINYYGTAVIQPGDTLKSLIRQKVLPDKTYNYAEFEGGDYPYTEKTVKSGTYTAILKAYGEDGSVEEADVTINVKNPEVKKSGFFENLMKIFRDFFHNLFTSFIKN